MSIQDTSTPTANPVVPVQQTTATVPAARPATPARDRVLAVRITMGLTLLWALPDKAFGPGYSTQLQTRGHRQQGVHPAARAVHDVLDPLLDLAEQFGQPGPRLRGTHPGRPAGEPRRASWSPSPRMRHSDTAGKLTVDRFFGGPTSSATVVWLDPPGQGALPHR